MNKAEKTAGWAAGEGAEGRLDSGGGGGDAKKGQGGGHSRPATRSWAGHKQRPQGSLCRSRICRSEWHLPICVWILTLRDLRLQLKVLCLLSLNQLKL